MGTRRGCGEAEGCVYASARARAYLFAPRFGVLRRFLLGLRGLWSS